MIFSIRQLQGKCREQQMPLCIAFIDLSKAFDFVSRQGLFQLQKKIGCPSLLHSIIAFLHKDMQGIVSCDRETSEPFTIWSGNKQGCVLLRRQSLAFLSCFCWTMLSSTPRKASTYTPEVIASSSTWHDWRTRSKSAQSSSGSYFLLMMPHWPHTKRKSSNTLPASSLIPVRSLARPSASGRPKSWVRTSHRLLHHYWQPSAWSRWPLHLPWLNHLQQPVAWQWDQQTHCKSCQCNGKTEQESVVQQPADFQHQAPSVPGMRSQHAPVRKWIMDNLHKTEKPLGELSPLLPASHPRHYMAGQGHQHCCAGAHWLSQHTAPPLSAQAALAQPHASHGRRPHPKRCAVWGPGNRTLSRRHCI